MLTETHPETQGNARGLLPGARGWELRLGREGQLPGKEAPALPILNVQKTTLTVCCPLSNASLRWLGETRVLAAYCGVVHPCWQGFNLHLKQDKWTAEETPIIPGYVVCAGRYRHCLKPLSYISSPWLFFGLSNNFSIQGCAFSKESLSPPQG